MSLRWRWLMSRSRLATAGIVLAGVLAFPSVSSASFMDFIYEMSGPQLISLLPVRCEYDFEKERSLCEILKWRVAGEANPKPKFWVAFDSAAYLSTWKDSPTGQYAAGKTDMLSFDPMVRWRYSSKSYFGAGGSTNFFFGTRFRRFGAAA